MSDLPWLASLIKSRNTIDSKIATVIGRNAHINNVGAYIASIVFDVELDDAGARKGYDGHFRAGALAGQTVDVQWRVKQDGLLNIRPEALPDYYLVLMGPDAPSNSPSLPWTIESVFLFESKTLLGALHERGVLIGSNTSITGPLWERAELYPVPRNPTLMLTEEARKLLFLFH